MQSKPESPDTNEASTPKKSRKNANHPICMVHIKSSFNNTTVTFTDPFGNVIQSSSAGAHGFKNARKSTPFAAETVIKTLSSVARDKFGTKSIHIIVNGGGPGRNSAVLALREFFKILSIKDATKLPHNGCRPPKERRV